MNYIDFEINCAHNLDQSFVDNIPTSFEVFVEGAGSSNPNITLDFGGSIGGLEPSSTCTLDNIYQNNQDVYNSTIGPNDFFTTSGALYDPVSSLYGFSFNGTTG
jgi:hypothetical protein